MFNGTQKLPRVDFPHPTNGTLSYSSEARPHSSGRQSGPEESDFTRYILLTTVLSYLTLATLYIRTAQITAQPCRARR